VKLARIEPGVPVLRPHDLRRRSHVAIDFGHRRP